MINEVDADGSGLIDFPGVPDLDGEDEDGLDTVKELVEAFKVFEMGMFQHVLRRIWVRSFS